MSPSDWFRRWLSPSLFALTALCFLLPFATVSCDNASTTFTGAELVTHTVPHGGVLHEAPDCSTDIAVCVERDAAPTATIALAAALAGLLFGLAGLIRGPGLCATVAFGALLVLPFEGPFFGPDVTTHYGWSLAVSSSAIAGWLHLRRAWRRRRDRRQRCARGALWRHGGALVDYALIASVCGALSTTSDPTPQAIGTAATAWLLFLVIPAWFLVAGLLIRWQRQGRPQLVQRTGRWDALLWLGPFLVAALCSRRVRAFLIPPSATANPSAEDRPRFNTRLRLVPKMHRKEMPCAPSSS
jgi:hypothetical protein